MNKNDQDKEQPEKMLFGIIPIYKNRFAEDGTLWGSIKPYAYAACLVIPLYLFTDFLK